MAPQERTRHMLYLVPGFLSVCECYLYAFYYLFFRLLLETIKKKIINPSPLMLPQPGMFPPFSHELY